MGNSVSKHSLQAVNARAAESQNFLIPFVGKNAGGCGAP